jgi:N-acetyl-gamma-glutamyl-phosphate reductase
MVKVGIIGASGYTGGELIRLLAGHPGAEVTAITSRTHARKKLEEVFPSFAGWDGPKFSGSDSPEAVAGCDLVFLAVPHGVAMEIAPALLSQGQKVIDLGADFRFRDAATFETWYKHPHSQPEMTRSAVYGLPEIHRNGIAAASLVGNPGCYPTSIILGCYPFIKAGVIDRSRIIADSKSGVSGAGRQANLGYHFPELNGNFKAYGLPAHRHTPEIEQELAELAGETTVTISFTPHLLPVSRGILSTLHLALDQPLTTAEAEELVMEAYRDEPFVKLVQAPGLPDLKGVAGTNFCHIGVRVDPRTRQLIVVAVIDNMVKGASGQAVQNMNLMTGQAETTGLLQWPIFP